jgi:inositol transport system ATP-binding protein
MGGGQALLEVHDVSKAFPGVRALEQVSLSVAPGSVHALIGENGAGKSTLMKIIAGVLTPDGGTLSLAGRHLALASPRDALENGIAMIHQELNLLPHMSVAENIWIGREPLNAIGLVNHRELNARTRALLGRMKLAIEPDAPVHTLPIATRQMIEIAKALSCASKLLIMDEPTSALTEHEAQKLFELIREFKAAGHSVLYITHKFEELPVIADEISVFRDGRCVRSGLPADTARDELIRLMVGRELAQLYPPLPDQGGPVALEVRGLALSGAFCDVSFTLHAGEVLGVAGLIGSGRSKLAEALFGLAPAATGRILIGGVEACIDSPQAAMAHGIAFVTEDRKETGCFLALSVLENLEITVLQREFVRAGFVRGRAVSAACAEMSRALRVKTRDLHERIENLSGGNQQKVLLGRWLLTAPKILILDEPTRGVDVAAKAEIHRLIASLVAAGSAVLMISSELPEILGMSHRIMVMHEGRVTGILGRSEADQIKIMDLAAR